MTSDTDVGLPSQHETSSIPSAQMAESPVNAQWQYGDGDIVKTELIIAPEIEHVVAKVCRLCGVEDTTWFPFYKSDEYSGLATKHLDMMRLLASIQITPETDHSSVVCSFCLMKIEEFAIIRNIWRKNNSDDSKLTPDKHSDPTSMVPTQTEDTAECGEAEHTVQQEQPIEESIIIKDESDSDVEIVSSSTSLPAERVCRRVTRSEQMKCELIEQAIQIVGRQFKTTRKRKVNCRRTR